MAVSSSIQFKRLSRMIGPQQQNKRKKQKRNLISYDIFSLVFTVATDSTRRSKRLSFGCYSGFFACYFVFTVATDSTRRSHAGRLVGQFLRALACINEDARKYGSLAALSLRYETCLCKWQVVRLSKSMFCCTGRWRCKSDSATITNKIDRTTASQLVA